MDPTVIVLVSFVVFLGIAYHLGYRQSMAALDQKIASIRQSLEDATQAKEAAIQALHKERRHHGEVQEEVNLIARRAEEQALLLQQQALHDINKMIDDRQQAAKEMMERMHNAAIQTIREEAAEITLAAFEELVRTKFSPAQQEVLNQEAIAQIVAQLSKSQTVYAPKPKRIRSKRLGVS
jgi:F-type H+-transporting ATPase subunit b